MTPDIELLTQQLEQNPGNVVLESMLVDELTEQGMVYAEAERHVRNVSLVAVQAGELREATHLMRRGSRTGQSYSAYCRRWCGVPPRVPYTLLVVVGHDAPYFAPLPPGMPEANLWHNVICVGAAFILSHHATAENRRKVNARVRRLRRRTR